MVCDEISARIQKARLAFANLRHVWRRRDIRLPTKGRVYCAAVRSFLLYGNGTWPFEIDEIDELTTQYLMDILYPKQEKKQFIFQKPQGPMGRRPRTHIH
ncbi:unnamed protein product [Schistosoma mattheei]|uniref:Uncharacterized protein n=1 Tax=Schistosoma mattheei TaxID=31246 RepID=A0A3P8EVI5_9TREM|nr:unnamed protein product [Schistosoma mattheei]